MATAVLAGSTGLVGSQILSQLLIHPSISTVFAYTRRELQVPPTSTGALNSILSTKTSTWISQFPTSQPTPKLFFSGLGTTQAAAGGLEAQRKIDLDLNFDLAKAAREAGVETYVLISSHGANSKSKLTAYLRMKGELEDRVKELGFRYTVIVRPGAIMGDRVERRPAEAIVTNIAKGLNHVSPMLTDCWAQDKEVVARAAIRVGLQCVNGERKEEGIWELGQREIVKLGKD